MNFKIAISVDDPFSSGSSSAPPLIQAFNLNNDKNF
jgi:hypothetical protein